MLSSQPPSSDNWLSSIGMRSCRVTACYCSGEAWHWVFQQIDRISLRSERRPADICNCSGDCSHWCHWCRTLALVGSEWLLLVLVRACVVGSAVDGKRRMMRISVGYRLLAAWIDWCWVFAERGLLSESWFWSGLVRPRFWPGGLLGWCRLCPVFRSALWRSGSICTNRSS